MIPIDESHPSPTPLHFAVVFISVRTPSVDPRAPLGPATSLRLNPANSLLSHGAAAVAHTFFFSRGGFVWLRKRRRSFPFRAPVLTCRYQCSGNIEGSRPPRSLLSDTRAAFGAFPRLLLKQVKHFFFLILPLTC